MHSPFYTYTESQKHDHIGQMWNIENVFTYRRPTRNIQYMDREQIIAVSKCHLKLLDTAVMNGEIKS